MRKFQEVNTRFIKHPDVPTNLPVRGTKYSAGYDFSTKTLIRLPQFKVVTVWTDVKVYTNCDEYLQIQIRSSLGKAGIIIANAPGVIDHDYADNQQTGGNIGIMLINIAQPEGINLAAGERIAQGIFQRYALTDDDGSRGELGKRTGGYGSTGRV